MYCDINKLSALNTEIRREPSEKREKRKVIVVKGDKHVYSKPIEYFTFSEVQKLIDETKDDYYRLAYLLLYESGCEPKEARELKFEDIDIPNRKVKIRTYAYALKGKDVFRYVNLSNRLVSLIISHKAVNNLSDSDFILAKTHGEKRIRIANIFIQLMYDMLNILGRCYSQEFFESGELYMSDYSRLEYIFRHSKAIHMLDAGVNILDVQAFFKHARPVTTARYLRHSKVGMEQAMKTNPELFMTKWVY